MQRPRQQARGQPAGAEISLASDQPRLPQLASANNEIRVERACRLVEWKPWPFDNPSLIGHCTVAFAGGWVVHAIPVFRKGDGGLSVGTPDIPVLDREGRIKFRDGKKQYVKLVTFETNEGRERWQRMILSALATSGIVGEAA